MDSQCVGGWLLVVGYLSVVSGFGIRLKYLGNFWRSLNSLLINCEIELDLTWQINFIVSEIS